LLEISGDIRISQRDGPPSSSIVDSKLNLLMGELERYGISVAGVQETKWFGSNVWPAVYGHIMLHSGRSVPQDGATVIRREDVGIVLIPRTAAAWKAAG